MRHVTRIVLATAAIALGAAASSVRAQGQDPEPAPAVKPEPAEQIIAAPADEPPTVAGQEAPEPAVAAPVDGAQAEALNASAVEAAPLDPPPAAEPAIDTSARYWPPARDDEPARSRKPSDWIFLGIIALAIIVILVRLAREQRDRVSIHDDRFPPSSAGPPVVRHP